MTFQEYLDSRNIDQQSLTDELWNALILQWQAEELAKRPPATILLIPDDIEERWSRAVRVPTCSH